VLAASIVSLFSLVACSSPGSPAASSDPILIGVVTTCEQAFSDNGPATLAGAELPFIARGAHLIDPPNSAGGVTSIRVGDRQVAFIYACNRYGDRSTTIFALSSLVERSGADIVIGSYLANDSVALREYARAHPDVTFIATGSEQSPTLRRTVPNLYRFEPDAYQWNAPLGTYARRVLGWNNAATFGDSNLPGYQVDGFIAKFCSLGGQVAQGDRLFLDQAHGLDPGPLVSQINGNVDGLFLTGTTNAGPIAGTYSMVPRWRETHVPLRKHLLVGYQLMWYAPQPALRGGVGSSPDPFRGTRAWRTGAWHAYVEALHREFPSLHDTGFYNLPYYDGVEPVLEALEQVNGDLSDGQREFAQRLAQLHYHSPEGLITLDQRHQAIGPVYLGRVVRKNGELGVKQIAVFKHVHQTLGGYFTPRSPAPSQTEPTCRSGS
jgi:branched-chain amino acid transport system substrate-binding protein